MKKLLTLTLALAALTFIVSCGGDEANPDNLTIDETVVSGLVLNAYMIDEGYCCGGEVVIGQRAEGASNTTYTTFLLTDGEYIFDTEGEIEEFIEGDLELEIEIDVNTEGTSFSTGEYDLYDDCNGNEFNYGVELYANWYDEGVYYYFNDRSGTLNITGSGTTYTFSFDGTLYDQSYGGPVRQEGNPEYCASLSSVNITGKIKRDFTPISREVWWNWD